MSIVAQTRDVSLAYRELRDLTVELAQGNLRTQSASNIESILRRLCEVLRMEIERKQHRMKCILDEQNEVRRTIEEKELTLKNKKREAKQAADNLKEAKGTMEKRKREKREAEKELDDKKEQLEKKKAVAAGVGIGGAIGSVLSLGFGAAPALAATTAAAAAVTVMLGIVLDAELKLERASEYYDDARGAFNSADRDHDAADEAKDAADAEVRRTRGRLEKLNEEKEKLRVDLECLVDLLRRMKDAEAHSRRTWKSAEEVLRVVTHEISMGRFRDHTSVVRVCGELLAKMEVLSTMKVLAIEDERGYLLQSAGHLRRANVRALESAEQRMIAYETASFSLDDYT